jgi:hypothetical protein
MSSDASTSSPIALFAGANPTASEASGASIVREFTSVVNPTKARLSFDLMFAGRGSSEVYVAYLVFQHQQAVYYIQLATDADRLDLVEDWRPSGTTASEASDSLNCDAAPIVGAWAHIAMDVDLTTARASVRVNGSPPCTKTLLWASQQASSSYFPQLQLGIPWAARGTGTWAVFEDSVVFDLPP